MMRSCVTLFILTCIAFHGLKAQPDYEHRKGDPDGIDKWYMGRQIAQVMSHYGIGWLERSSREQEDHASQLVQNLGLKKGMVVADFGAGSGYYSVRIAKEIGKGTVYAVDISTEMLEYIRDRVRKENIEQIKTLQSTEKETGLPPSSVDLMLLVDVYHELSFPKEMAASMYQAIKPKGRLCLVEYRAEDPSVAIKAVHKMTEVQILKEMQVAGFVFEQSFPNLPRQHCLFFRKN